MEEPNSPGEAGNDSESVVRYPYLSSLNKDQLKAVTAPPSTPLQILAGPGSGKTRVLTSRVAHLVKRHGYKPRQITAVTFTNKAASEMRKRLQVLLGQEQADELVLGTFHATCARYLRKHGNRIGMKSNFAIADADDCKKIMGRLLKERAQMLQEMHMKLEEKSVLSEISKAKASGETPEKMVIRASRDQNSSTSILAVISMLYKDYETALRDAGALDFDDLLVFGLRLFRNNPDILGSCLHILVDEFQDTNIIQYELMRCFAAAHGGVSIVGDPDQSIYGWRSAEVENLAKMTRDFPGVNAIYLEENYRSTGAILSACHSIVSQDKTRIPKNLYTSHQNGNPVGLKTFTTPVIEASFISSEIKRLVAYSGGMLQYDDFAILLRYNALSRILESTLQKDGIPTRIIGGHKFFERMEIKDLLAYLQLADNPNFTPAFMRVINVPKRAIGDKSVSDLVAAAKSAKLSPMEMAERIVDGDKAPPGIKRALKKNLASFIGTVRRVRQAAIEGTSVNNLIRLVLEQCSYEEHLRSTQTDFDQRWENVQELINFSVSVAEDQQRQAETTPLSFFLQSSMLSTDTESNEDTANAPRVTISTVHAAKGLEWPVVFVPSVEDGTFPFYRCDTPEQVAEERRLLYVAMTRAQCFLTLSYCLSRLSAGEERERKLSPFVVASNRATPSLFTAAPPKIEESDRSHLSKMLSRSKPDENTTRDLIAKHLRLAPSSNPQLRYGVDNDCDFLPRPLGSFAARRPPSSESDSRPGFVSFSSARSMAAYGDVKPKPSPPKIASSNKGYPAPIPFTFDQKPAVGSSSTNLSSFTTSSNSSLAAMKTLGLPSNNTSATLDARRSGHATTTRQSPMTMTTVKLSNSQSNQRRPSPEPKPALETVKLSSAQSDSIRPPPQTSSGVKSNGQSSSESGNAQPIKKRRLGVGRPVLGWGQKRTGL